MDLILLEISLTLTILGFIFSFIWILINSVLAYNGYKHSKYLEYNELKDFTKIYIDIYYPKLDEFNKIEYDLVNLDKKEKISILSLQKILDKK